jgi:hypothetical protein
MPAEHALDTLRNSLAEDLARMRAEQAPPGEPARPLAEPIRLPSQGPSRLEAAWQRITLEGVCEILNRYTAGGWRPMGDKRIEGPCPALRGKCKGDPVAAFVYERTDGGPPFVHCSHRNSCGQVTSVYDVVAGQHTSPNEAVRAIMIAAGLDPDEGSATDWTALAALGPPFAPTPPRPGESAAPIEIERARIDMSDNVAEMKDACETVLLSHGVELYVNGRTLARIARVGGKARIEPIPNASLMEIVSRHAMFLRYNEEGEAKRVLPPKVVIEALGAAGSWQFAELEALTSTPTVLADGSVVTTPGYSRVARLYYAPDADYPPLPDRPTWEDARAAAAALMDPFCDFPFVEDCDRAAAIALVVTNVVRVAIQGPTPLFLVRAAAAGTGKNLLADVAAIIATGQEATILETVDDAAEWRKQITTAVLSGAPFVVLDEAETLNSKALASSITSQWWTDRVLGSNREVRVRRPVFAACGNNTALRGDMARRCIPIEIYSESENPEKNEKPYRYPDLRAHVKTSRSPLLMAALTLVRAYLAAGSPAQSLEPYGSFEAWSGIVRAALVWAGLTDPCAGRDRLREEADEGRNDLRMLLVAWRRVFGGEPVTAQQLAVSAATDEELADALAPYGQSKNGLTIDARKLPYGLRRIKGRVVDGMRLEWVRDMNARRWRVSEIVKQNPQTF